MCKLSVHDPISTEIPKFIAAEVLRNDKREINSGMVQSIVKASISFSVYDGLDNVLEEYFRMIEMEEHHFYKKCELIGCVKLEEKGTCNLCLIMKSLLHTTAAAPPSAVRAHIASVSG